MLSSTTGDVSPSTRPHARDELTALRPRVERWVAGRIVVALLLFGGTLLVDSRPEAFQEFTPRALIAVVATTLVFALVSVVLLPQTRFLRSLAIAQMVGDIAMSTALVYLLGGVASGFTFLYGVATLVTAVLLGPREARIASVLGLVVYVTIGTSLANGWLPRPPDQPESHYLLSKGEVGAAIVRNVVGLSLVSLLATALASRLRSAGGELRAASENAATLARLNDDIVRSMAAGLITTDTDGVVRTINAAGASMLKTSSESAVGKSIREYLPEFDTHPARDSHDTVVRRETSATRPDGSSIHVGFTRTPLVVEDGSSVGNLIVFQDLSDLVSLREKAERAERLAALGRIAAGLAHEIRNPLGAISGSVQLVRESARNEEDDRLLSIVQEEVERLDTLVTNMLDATQVRPAQRSKVDLIALARDVVDVAKRARGVTHSIELQVLNDAQAVEAKVDTAQMRQVLWNLLKNAQQNAPAGTRIDVRVERLPSGSAQLSVRDEGSGLPAEVRAHLFEMFHPGRPHGIGIGLALVKQIVDAHDATIVAESNEGAGTTFRVTLPAE